MPREIQAWAGKPATAPPAPAPPAQTASAVSRSENAAREPAEKALCPKCLRGTLVALASGGWGCTCCAEILRTENYPDAAPGVADQIDAINAMLRRNALTLGPGGVPLAENNPNKRRARR
ncbi:MAG TPA: hypothetical protein VEK08_23175 [Planctomycetota bacterium]|nr:hypothetical protein [Planctomycetota bacterium]